MLPIPPLSGVAIPRSAAASVVANQPWNHVVWPSSERDAVGSAIFGAYPRVYDVAGAARIPAFARATSIYAETIKQCALDAYRGANPLPRSRLLDRPDPDRNRAWFVKVQIEDYLWHGNAVHLVTTRGVDGWPTSAAWIPAAWLYIESAPGRRTKYQVAGSDGRMVELPADDVVHVRRSADRRNPSRGVGVVEEHLATLDRMVLEEEFERNTLLGSAVPSVAVISNNPDLSQDEADDGKASWTKKLGGPVREPVILPAGTTVVPLAWSPEQSQWIEARKMSLLDCANLMNLDGYWLGAPTTSLTYRSPGPLYTSLLRTSLEGVMADVEQTWSDAWLPRGQILQFDRLALTRDDLSTTAETLAKLIDAGVFSPEEAREYLRLAPRAPGAVSTTSPVDTVDETPQLEGS